jgi:hypothetical protein
VGQRLSFPGSLAVLGAVAVAFAAARVTAGAAPADRAEALAGGLFPRGLAPVDVGLPDRASARAAACAGCHAEAHRDWAASRHGRAFTNAIFQREYRDRPLEWCVHCHAPLREQLDEVRRGGGPFADEGVTCVACHVRDGRMLARTHAPLSPHDTLARPDFGGPAYCAGCHQFNFPIIESAKVVGYTDHPMQDTVGQHDRGPRAGEACLSCHGSGSGGHRFPGGHDPEQLSRALKVEACRDGKRLVVHLQNDGAGHNVPTGDVHRHLVLRAWQSRAPERLWQTVLGRRFEPAEDGGKRTIADETLPPGGGRVVAIPLDALGPGRDATRTVSLELRLVYTIDEYPFRGRELAEPTWATMFARELEWRQLPACERSGAR